MEHDEPGRRPGRPRRGAAPRGGERQPAPRGSARRGGSSRRTPPARGGAPRGGRPERRRRPAPRDEAGYAAPEQETFDAYDPYEQPYDADEPAGPEPEHGPEPEGRGGAGPGRGGRGGRPGRSGKSGKGGKASGRGGKSGKGGKRPAENGGRPGGRGGSGGGPTGPRLYFGAAAGLGVIVVLALVLVAVTGSDGKDGKGAAVQDPGRGTTMGQPAASGPSPSSYSSSPSAAAYRAIERRSADTAPLTVGELFPSSAAAISGLDGKARPTLREKRLDGDCAAAVWGTGTATSLRAGGCSQAGRGVYADTKRGYALSVTVFNLAAAADADRVVDALGRGRGGGFVRPVPAGPPLDRFGRGYGMARGLAMGHFAVVAWAQRLDGKGDERDETLLSLLIEGGKSPAVLGRAARTTTG
ncbi:hypothetical protein [Actinomadura xylanilytica]|uniref:hypothetical protein n=1 Tax=Actinomadura xylanilytica TaxID=887459 RepID=UPI00255B38DE|nr:hypothetical protein [Actinomadura xylanilytica]MDL4770950.1 hypothetical protein [Actinomadura xylanilytica]